MTDKVQKIRKEVERIHNLLPIMDGDNISINYADRICTTLEMYIDSLQEEPVSEENLSNVQRTVKNWKEELVSEDLEEACEQLAENARKHKAETVSPFFSQTDYRQGVIDGAQWKKEQMLKTAFSCEIGKSIKEGKAVLCGNFAFQNAGDKVKIIIVKED